MIYTDLGQIISNNQEDLMSLFPIILIVNGLYRQTHDSIAAQVIILKFSTWYHELQFWVSRFRIKIIVTFTTVLFAAFIADFFAAFMDALGTCLVPHNFTLDITHLNRSLLASVIHSLPLIIVVDHYLLFILHQ